MDRRSFLTAIGTPPPVSAAKAHYRVADRTNTSLKEYSGPWTETEISHLLKRTMFGSTKTDIKYFKNKTMIQAVDELLAPASPLPAPPVKDYDTTGVTTPDTNIAAGTTWVNDTNNDGTIQSRRRAAFKKWWMGLLINQDRSIREKMTLFLHNHFSTETNDVGNAQYIFKHHAMLRANALGNFKTITRQVAIDPAMLVYLNGQYNTATAPDENFGRELQELFCCGKGPDSLYTEADVKAAAKVLTGWRNNATLISSFFDSTKHDTGNKQFSAFYGNTVITGKTGATAGDLELDALINMIFSANEVAKYICRRIYRWFVYYDIDVAVENNVIQPLADIFRKNNYEIKPVLNALLKSEHFYDAFNQGCLIKSPLDLVIGFCRELNIQFPASADYVNNYGLWNGLLSFASNMQQNLGDPPDISGWKAYYQSPQFYEIWINSDTLPKRNQFTDQLTLSGYTFGGKKIQVDSVAIANTVSDPSDPNILLDEIIALMFRMPLSSAVKSQIKKDILLGGQVTDNYWTTAWIDYNANPNNTANATIVKNRLRDLFKYLMNLAEYQLS
ncbi:MAG: hypothetical protein JWN76_1974 [Chitinophagaceae bacterium]|nr:hypothetical protein [Chitinophagaceae bacterium]